MNPMYFMLLMAALLIVWLIVLEGFVRQNWRRVIAEITVILMGVSSLVWLATYGLTMP